MGGFSDFQRGQIVGARLTGASVTKTATLLRVSRAAVSKVMMTHTNHERMSSAKRNSGRKAGIAIR
jgi:predicted transcriptional regulator